MPIESPALHAIFRNNDKIKTAYEVTEKGIVVVQTSADANTVKALQDHAAEVTDLAQRGMVAAHEAMMKNGGGMMGRGMRGGPWRTAAPGLRLTEPRIDTVVGLATKAIRFVASGSSSAISCYDFASRIRRS